MTRNGFVINWIAAVILVGVGVSLVIRGGETGGLGAVMLVAAGLLVFALVLAARRRSKKKM